MPAILIGERQKEVFPWASIGSIESVSEIYTYLNQVMLGWVAICCTTFSRVLNKWLAGSVKFTYLHGIGTTLGNGIGKCGNTNKATSSYRQQG